MFDIFRFARRHRSRVWCMEHTSPPFAKKIGFEEIQVVGLFMRTSTHFIWCGVWKHTPNDFRGVPDKDAMSILLIASPGLKYYIICIAIQYLLKELTGHLIGCSVWNTLLYYGLRLPLIRWIERKPRKDPGSIPGAGLGLNSFFFSQSPVPDSLAKTRDLADYAGVNPQGKSGMVNGTHSCISVHDAMILFIRERTRFDSWRQNEGAGVEEQVRPLGDKICGSSSGIRGVRVKQVVGRERLGRGILWCKGARWSLATYPRWGTRVTGRGSLDVVGVHLSLYRDIVRMARGQDAGEGREGHWKLNRCDGIRRLIAWESYNTLFASGPALPSLAGEKTIITWPGSASLGISRPYPDIVDSAIMPSDSAIPLLPPPSCARTTRNYCHWPDSTPSPVTSASEELGYDRGGDSWRCGGARAFFEECEIGINRDLSSTLDPEAERDVDGTEDER
ncbi:hypothetical protein B0H11DRAFT_1942224 [Mycena galericulata]|nr:hypothetical protein B0H11DRAFT_1942224 [Mycena galericulata]